MNPQLRQFLAVNKIRFVRVVWCDSAGIIRAKAVHTLALEDGLPHGVGITPAQMALPAQGDSVVPGAGLGPVGEIRLVPDWGTLTALPYAPGHARVLGNMLSGGTAWSLCPRAFLQRMCAALEAEGFTAQAAFENEFYLLRATEGGFAALEDSVFASTWSMDLNRACIDDLASALLAQGLHVEAYYPESGPGQQELSVRHDTPLRAADQQITFRETVRGVAIGHGLRGSFLPKPFANQAGSGAHLHLSLWREGQNIVPLATGTGGMSAVTTAFVAGILAHLPALMAVTAPSPNSYRRLQPGCWAGAYHIWGVDNREAALRVRSHPDGQGARDWELKTVDGTCNPHLALGAVLACGLDGLRRGLTLPAETTVDPASLSDSERKASGIERLPENLSQALGHFEASELLRLAMGEPLHQAFLAVRRAEALAMTDRSFEDEVRLLWERY